MPNATQDIPAKETVEQVAPRTDWRRIWNDKTYRRLTAQMRGALSLAALCAAALTMMVLNQNGTGPHVIPAGVAFVSAASVLSFCVLTALIVYSVVLARRYILVGELRAQQEEADDQGNDHTTLAWPGVTTEFISAVFFYLYNRASNQMQEYHRSLIAAQNTLLAITLIEELKGPERAGALLQLIGILVGKEQPKPSVTLK